MIGLLFFLIGGNLFVLFKLNTGVVWIKFLYLDLIEWCFLWLDFIWVVIGEGVLLVYFLFFLLEEKGEFFFFFEEFEIFGDIMNFLRLNLCFDLLFWLFLFLLCGVLFLLFLDLWFFFIEFRFVGKFWFLIDFFMYIVFDFLFFLFILFWFEGVFKVGVLNLVDVLGEKNELLVGFMLLILSLGFVLKSWIFFDDDEEFLFLSIYFFNFWVEGVLVGDGVVDFEFCRRCIVWFRR